MLASLPRVFKQRRVSTAYRTTRIDMVNPGAASSRDGTRTRRVISIATPNPVASTGSSLSRPDSSPKTRDAA